MAQTTNLNVSPYFDDFNEDNDYYKVLFKPGLPVQARELTGLQSILQNQIARFGQHVFKEGAKVIPGNTSYYNDYFCVELNNEYLGVTVESYIDQLLGRKIVGLTSGVTAIIQKILKSSNNSNLKTVKIIGNFHGTLSYERQRKVIKKFGWSFRLAGFDALNYCLLAEGTVDAVIEANLKPYDILPLIPIIKNSGAIVTNWKNEPAEIGGDIIASSNKALHNKILRLLKPFTKK